MKIFDEEVKVGPDLNKGHEYVSVYSEGESIRLFVFGNVYHKAGVTLKKKEAKELINLLLKYV